MQNIVNKVSTPISVKICIGIAVLGLAFPIYGIPMSSFKLTIFRFAIFLLVPLVLLYGIRLKSRYVTNVLVLFFLLAMLRAATLGLIAAEYSRGVQQLVWFLEGILFLLIVVSFSERFADFYEVFLRTLFYIGGISVVIMGAQFVSLLFGGSWTLPFSTSAFGFEEASRFWTYPYQGGQVIGPFYEYNMAGSMCAFYFSAFLPFAFEKYNICRLNRYLLLVLLSVAIFALIGTGSKQGFLAVLFVSALLVIKSRIYKKILAASMLVSIILGTFLVTKTTDTSLLDLLPETTFYRYEVGVESGDLSGGRVGYIRDLLGTINLDNILFGIGEGMGLHGAHNAFLILLQENGLIGLLGLIWLCVYFLYASMLAGYHKQTGVSYLRISSVGVVSVWLLLIFINWAQLNVSISFLYLAVPLLYLNRVNEYENRIRLPSLAKA